jgi:glycosyltransferase involved in cell wall biosynthesis
MSDIYRHLKNNHAYDITFVVSESDDYDPEGFNVVSIPEKAWRPNTQSVPRLRRHPLFLRRNLYRKHIDPLLRKHDAILTVDPTIYQQAILPLRRADKLDIPAWVDVSVTNAGGGSVRHKIAREALDKTTGIVATVPKCLDRLEDINLLDRETATKFTIMGHPVDTDKFCPESIKRDDDTCRVLTLARLNPEKGLYYIIEAMAPLLSNRDDIQLEILGEGKLEPLLRREITERGINDSVTFRGTVPHDEVPDVMNRADIYLNHSVARQGWEEYFGVANLEAMACGLPCIVSDCDNIPYVIRCDDCVRMVDQRNVAGLRSAVSDLVKSPEEREALGHRARKYVEQTYRLDKIAEKYHRMLQAGIEDS